MAEDEEAVIPTDDKWKRIGPVDDTWCKIGATCSAGRRSLWFRITYVPEDNEVTNPHELYRESNVQFFELRAGREGDDSYIKVDRTNNQFSDLLDVLLTAEFAATT
jgi:hypothetical protein